MKKLLFCFLAVLSLLFGSCLKDLNELGYYNTVLCKGIVVEEYTSRPIPNVRVLLSDGLVVDCEVLTAQDGSFELEIPIEKFQQQCYVIIKSDSLHQEFQVLLDEFEIGMRDYYLDTLFMSSSHLPYVTVADISDITPTSALCIGMIVDNGYASILEEGFVYDTVLYPTLSNQSVVLPSGEELFSATITLKPDKQYYVRAFARNELGVGYSEPVPVMSGSVLPQVSTHEVSDISANSVVCGGEIVSTGGGKILSRGLCWSIQGNPTISNSKLEMGYGDGQFEGEISGLIPGTNYVIRAYAQNEHGYSYGEPRFFTTLSGLPTVITGQYQILSQNCVEIQSEVADDGGFSVIQRGVCFGTSHLPTLNANHTSDGSGVGTYTSQLVNLSQGVRYYYRSYATNGVGTVYGDEGTFVIE